jgi:hypothetical protein
MVKCASICSSGMSYNRSVNAVRISTFAISPSSDTITPSASATSLSALATEDGLHMVAMSAP